MIDFMVIENTGPLEDILSSGDINPICEVSAWQTSKTSAPLKNSDLNNINDGYRVCKISTDGYTLTVY